MGAGGNLGDDAAVSSVVGDLGKHNIRQDAAGTVRLALDYRGCGLVAACLYAEDDHLETILALPASYAHDALLARGQSANRLHTPFPFCP